jgi:hypothetical protein
MINDFISQIVHLNAKFHVVQYLLFFGQVLSVNRNSIVYGLIEQSSASNSVNLQNEERLKRQKSYLANPMFTAIIIRRRNFRK